jgi:membrane-bound serine protease (ClpP class)
MFAISCSFANFVPNEIGSTMKSIRYSWLSKFLLLIGIVIVLTSARTANDSVNVNRNNKSQNGTAIPTKKGLVYIFDIRKEIAKPVWRITQQAFKEAMSLHANYILIHINTYGGMVNIADSIRTKILNSPIPVMVFIDNQAISAGALISIAADSIYMRPGASIGAATVVDQSGAALPDKYQSFMRSTMRATAEAHGRDTIIKGNDTTYVWRRDPHIAEAMVDPRIVVKGVIDSGKVLTLTVDEAIKVGYCEGKANSLTEVLVEAGLSDYETKYYEMKAVDSIIVFLLNPIIQTLLIILIIGGIYFELQTPGIGFPLGIAITAALLYFAPLYLQGLAQNWEILAFIAGIILLALEIFVIPGFGIAGISGILLILISLTLAVIDNVVFKFEGLAAMTIVVKVFGRILLTVLISFGLSLWLSKKVGTSGFFKGLALDVKQDSSAGYISIDTRQKAMIGKTGIAYTVLRPSGRIKIEGELFDAKAEIGFIDKGSQIKVIRDEAGQLYVIKV